MTRTERITAVPSGRQIPLRLRATGKTTTETVLPPCDQKNNGCWYCVTHQHGFENQMQKDSHISVHGEHGPRAKHELVWLCFAHGPEQP